MANKRSDRNAGDDDGAKASASTDDLLLAALERGDDSFETGRYLVTFKEDAVEQGIQSLTDQGMRIADARDFDGQATTLESLGDADTLVFPEIGVALVGGGAARERGLRMNAEGAADDPVESIDPEYFMFPLAAPPAYPRDADATSAASGEYLRGFVEASEAIAQGLRNGAQTEVEDEEEALVLGATWGLVACKVPPSVRSGAGIKVAVLDTGFDLGHPDFVGRPIVSQTFVGQPVQDLNGHGTHCTGTACGPKAPAGSTPRYGIAYRSLIHIGKVLPNGTPGTMAAVLAGMNWAIANRCAAISVSLGAPIGVQPGYTAAGRSALNSGCLIIAAAGNTGPNGLTGAPANSPTIMAVGSLDQNLKPSSFSSIGKIDIAAPGANVFSSVPRPTRYGVKSGTSMATPHVAGCAALWAETSAGLRGIALWRKLLATAKPLPFPPSKVGAGLVQAP